MSKTKKSRKTKPLTLLKITDNITDPEMGLILQPISIPDEKKRALAPIILREWVGFVLQQHWTWEAEYRQAYTKQQLEAEKFWKSAQRFLESFGLLNEFMEAQIADRLALNAHLWPRENSQRIRRRLETEREFLRDLTAAVRQIWPSRGRGQPRGRFARRVMLDIAAIFDYLTDKKAGRQVNSVGHEEHGPFEQFARAIWLVLFGSGDRFLSALRNWQDSKGKIYSPVMYEMDLRQPEWGLFD